MGAAPNAFYVRAQTRFADVVITDPKCEPELTAAAEGTTVAEFTLSPPTSPPLPLAPPVDIRVGDGVTFQARRGGARQGPTRPPNTNHGPCPMPGMHRQRLKAGVRSG